MLKPSKPLVRRAEFGDAAALAALGQALNVQQEDPSTNFIAEAVRRDGFGGAQVRGMGGRGGGMVSRRGYGGFPAGWIIGSILGGMSSGRGSSGGGWSGGGGGFGGFGGGSGGGGGASGSW